MKKILSIVLAVMLIMSIIPIGLYSVTASAATSEFAGGDGTESSPYLISTAKHLDNIRLYPFAHYELANDIQFTSQDYYYSGSFYNSGNYWDPIDDFSGSLNGNNYSIDGLKIKRSYSGENIGNKIYTNEAFGLFSEMSGTVFDLTLSNVNIQVYVREYSSNGSAFSTSVDLGGLAGRSTGNISNCTVSGTITATGETDLVRACVGGIIGAASSDSSIANCCNNATVKAVCTKSTYSYGSRTYTSNSYAQAGGIVGGFAGNSVTNCTNYGAVSTNSIKHPYAGGIVGKSEHSLVDGNIDIQISDCYNYGTIEAKSTPPAKIDSSYTSYGYLIAYAGGIVAHMSETGVTHCGNFADVTARGWGACAGGVIGNADYTTSLVSQSFNKGNVFSYDTDTTSGDSYGNHYAGGITAAGGSIDQCHNTGSVTTTGNDYAKAGGITVVTFGKISNCYNAGDVNANEDALYSWAGGIIVDCPTAIEYCYNVGALSGAKKAGIACVVYDGSSNYDNERHLLYCYYIDNVATGVYQILNSCTMYTYKKTDSALKQQNTYANFDFDDIWTISNDGYDYPQLRKNTHHSYNSGVVTKQPTCQDTGVKTYTCTACGVTKTETIAKLTTHTYIDATCTLPKTCKVCGVTEGVALGHKYDNACDASCNACDVIRTVSDHVYDNACDADCNICGNTRSITHTYQNGICAVCGFEKNYTGVKEINGKLYLYVDGKTTRRGLYKIGDDYYFTDWGGVVYTDGRYYVHTTYCDLEGRHEYTFGADGKMLQGVVEKDGKLYLYINGSTSVRGLFKVGDDYYFADWGGVIYTDGKYYVHTTHCDLEGRHEYTFGKDGKMLQGVVEIDGTLYLYQNGITSVRGLFKVGEDYYFADWGGVVYTDGRYYVHTTHCDLEGRHEYTFGADGKMLDGVVEMDGQLYLYENGSTSTKGLFKIGDDYYFADWGGVIMTDGEYYVHTSHCDLEGGKVYTFGADGKMIL